jgi:hypothetical protein
MIDLTKNNRLIKILSIISFLLIIMALSIILVTPPAEGYEISIYDAFPWYFWLLIFISMMLGQIIIFFYFFKKNNEKNKIWLMALIIFFFNLCILLSMPYIRGYVTYGTGDHLTHIGWVKEIINLGSIQSTNFYPSQHILIAVISLIADISIIDVSTFLPRLFPFLFFVGFVIFSRFFFEKQKELLLSILFSSSFLFFGSMGNYLTPSLQLFLLVPLFLFLYFKRSMSGNTIPFNLLFIIFLIGFVFYHPFIFLFLILIIVISAISTFIFSKNKEHNQSKITIEPEKTKILMPIISSVVIFFAWYFSFSSIVKNFVRVFSSIFYRTGESPLAISISFISQYNILLSDYLRIGVFVYGRYLLIGLVSLLSIFFLIYCLFYKKEKVVTRYVFFLLFLTIFIFGTLTVFSYVFDFVVNWQRFFLFVNFFSIILFSKIFYILLNSNRDSKRRNHLKKLSIFIVTYLLFFISFFTFFYSPINNQSNLAVCRSECIGFSWFIENRNTMYLTDELGISQYRFYGALHHNTSVSSNLRYKNTIPPDHFGYNHSINLGSHYDEPNYFILSTLGRIMYPSLYPNYEQDWRFTRKDFQLLLDDSSVSSIYSNFGFDLFLII